MRRTVLSLVMVLAVASSLSAQAANNQILVSHGNLNYVMTITQDAFYLGEPALSVRAEAIPGATLRVSGFSVRGWQEGDHARVVVYAVLPAPEASGKALETAIATYTLKFGSAWTARVTESAEWGAAPIVLRAVRPLR